MKKNKKFVADLDSVLGVNVFLLSFKCSSEGDKCPLYVFPSKELAERYVSYRHSDLEYFISKIPLVGDGLVCNLEFAFDNGSK